MKEENTKELRKYLKWIDNKNKTSKWMGGSWRSYQRKIYCFKTYIRKEERHKIYSLMFHLKKLEKEKQSKSKVSRENNRDKNRIKWNRKQSMEKIIKAIHFLKEQLNLYPLARLIKKRESTVVINIKNESRISL